MRSWMRCKAAGLGLIVSLIDHDWEAQEGIDLEHNKQNTVRIKIGFKPSSYFMSKEMEKHLSSKDIAWFKEIKNREAGSYKQQMQDAQKDLKENGAHPFVFPHE